MIRAPYREQELHVLVDIDGTLTDNQGVPQIDPRYFGGNILLEKIRDLAVRKGLSRSEAEKRLTDLQRAHLFWDYADLAAGMHLDETECMSRLMDWHRKHLFRYPDALPFLQLIKQREIPMSIISNNPRTGCEMKLRSTGLLEIDGSPTFQHLFTSNDQKGQKHDRDFWKRALHEGGLSPETCVMVGNHPLEDGQVPGDLGLSACFIIDRTLSAPSGSGRIRMLPSLLDVPPALTSLPSANES